MVSCGFSGERNCKGNVRPQQSQAECSAFQLHTKSQDIYPDGGFRSWAKRVPKQRVGGRPKIALCMPNTPLHRTTKRRGDGKVTKKSSRRPPRLIFCPSHLVSQLKSQEDVHCSTMLTMPGHCQLGILTALARILPPNNITTTPYQRRKIGPHGFVWLLSFRQTLSCLVL